MAKLKENQINNSYFIKQKFEQKAKAYHPPQLWRPHHQQTNEPYGKIKIYTEEEIFIYKLQNCSVKEF